MNPEALEAKELHRQLEKSILIHLRDKNTINELRAVIKTQKATLAQSALRHAKDTAAIIRLGARVDALKADGPLAAIAQAVLSAEAEPLDVRMVRLNGEWHYTPGDLLAALRAVGEA